MKNFTTIIILFAFLLVGVVGAAVAWKVVQDSQARQAEQQYEQYVQKYRTQQATMSKPSTLLTPTAAPAVTAASLTNDLGSVQDDGGTGDFNQLQTDINGL